LGAALALDLARRGWDLHLHYHTSESDARALAARIGELGRRARLIRADLAAPGGAEHLAEAVADTPPSLVVHSASLWSEDTAATATLDDWESSHRLHVWTAVVLARNLASWVPEGGEGHLVTLLDSRLRDRDSQHFSYAFAKRELAQLTRYLAAELAPSVRVNGLAPGLILKAEGAPGEPWVRAGRDATPLGRTGKTADLVRALRYLVENRFVTGQILAVDGGRHLKGDLFGSV
jgi:NAD(P)-dependent dehydrogenase (short-subunit alcohol dehydrogenase family)